MTFAANRELPSCREQPAKLRGSAQRFSALGISFTLRNTTGTVQVVNKELRRRLDIIPKRGDMQICLITC